MPRTFVQIKNDDELEAMIALLEEGIESAHAGTVDDEVDAEERDDDAEEFEMRMKFLRRIADEHPLFERDVDLKAGVEFDWESFWERVYGSAEDDKPESDLPREEAPASQKG